MTEHWDLEQIASAIANQQTIFAQNPYWQALDECLDTICPTLDNSTLKHIIMKIEAVDRLYRANLIQFIKRQPDIIDDKRLHYATLIGEEILTLDLDTQFDALAKKANRLNLECIDDVIQIHHDMAKTIERITKRSVNVFTSKYLHFCRPHFFPIMDSTSDNAVSAIMNNESNSPILERFGYDEAKGWYNYHCRGVLAIQSAVANADYKLYKLRELDKFFFGWS